MTICLYVCTCVCVCKLCMYVNARNTDQELLGHFLKIGYFVGYWLLAHLKCTGKIWPTKMYFGQPNVEIS